LSIIKAKLNIVLPIPLDQY